MTSGAWNKRTVEEVQEIVEALGYEMLEEYMHKKHRRVIIQDFGGYKYDVMLGHFAVGKTPDFVSKNNPFTLPNISLWLEKENKPFKLCENNIYSGCHEELFFRCTKEPCQEIFGTSWSEIYGGHGCPFCVNMRVGKRNNLAYLRPELAKEWDHIRNSESPEIYTCGSNKVVFWICSNCKHQWKAEIDNRCQGTGCPNCNNLRKESKVANELKTILKKKYEAKSEYKVLKNPDTGHWLPYDIYIPYGNNLELNGFYVEVHGEQHYKSSSFHKMMSKRNGTTPEEEFEYQKHKDKLKKKFAKKHGVYVEIDLRKIKGVEQAIKKVEKVLKDFSL